MSPSRRRPPENLKIDALAFVTYETPLTPCGGIAAVMKYLPDAVQRAAATRTVVLAPYHHKILGPKPEASELSLRGVVSVPTQPTPLQMHLMGHTRPTDKSEWIFCLPDDARLFSGQKHPYDVAAADEEEGGGLLYDALVFGAAIPKALHVLGPGLRWAVLLQDWEGATAALAFAAQSHDHALFLTLHNSYDSGAAPPQLLRKAGIGPPREGDEAVQGTVLSRALPLVRRPLLTVSQGFARDLTEEPLQKDVMTPHLTGLLHGPEASPIVGIDNGPFAGLSVPADILQKSKRLSARSKQGIRPLRAWKRARRAAFIEALQELVGDVPGGTQPLGARVWGDVAAFVEAHDPEARPQRPWFVMGGRDDPRQKGYDVAAQAARALLAGGADACFLWFPIPGDEGLNGLQFLADLAWEYPQQVLVFPFVFRAGYMAALQGATIALMPSFYEPFGAANEFYLQGTIGLGRATGGLVQQIIPLQKVEGLPNWSSYSPAVARRSQGWHLEDAPPTGLLYREADDLPSTVLDWQGINEAAYNQATPEGGQKQLDRVTERRQFAVWEAMVEECHKAMKEALQLYREHPLVFDQLLLNGIAYIQARFSWEQAARLYLQLAAPRLRLHPNKKP